MDCKQSIFLLRSETFCLHVLTEQALKDDAKHSCPFFHHAVANGAVIKQITTHGTLLDQTTQHRHCCLVKGCFRK